MECVDAAGDNARIRIKQFWSSRTHTHTRTHERMHACTNARMHECTYARTRARTHESAQASTHPPSTPTPLPHDRLRLPYRKKGWFLIQSTGRGGGSRHDRVDDHFPRAVCVCDCVCVKTRDKFRHIEKKYFLLPLYTMVHDA